MQGKKLELPQDTEIEVIAKKGETVVKKIMTIKEFKEIKRKKGWEYSSFQIGFSKYKT
jgi:hypothetical protein